MEQEPAATSQHALGQVKAEVKDEQVERHAPHAAECAVHLLQGSVKVEPEQQHEEQHQEDEEEEDEGEAYERRCVASMRRGRREARVQVPTWVPSKWLRHTLAGASSSWPRTAPS